MCVGGLQSSSYFAVEVNHLSLVTVLAGTVQIIQNLLNHLQYRLLLDDCRHIVPVEYVHVVHRISMYLHRESMIVNASTENYIRSAGDSDLDGQIGMSASVDYSPKALVQWQTRIWSLPMFSGFT